MELSSEQKDQVIENLALSKARFELQALQLQILNEDLRRQIQELQAQLNDGDASQMEA